MQTPDSKSPHIVSSVLANASYPQALPQNPRSPIDPTPSYLGSLNVLYDTVRVMVVGRVG